MSSAAGIRSDSDAVADRRRMRRFDWCVRGSVYLIFVTELLAATGASRLPNGGLAAYLTLGLAMVAHVVADIVMVEKVFQAIKVTFPLRRPPTGPLVAVLTTTVLQVGLWIGWAGPGGITAIALALFLGWTAICPAFRARVMLVGFALLAVVFILALRLSLRGFGTAFGLAMVQLGLMAFVVTGVWLSGWLYRLYYELDRARVDSARLAVAEERVRISRDLHDVFGRTLATVAVKSELASHLARRGRNAEAAEEIGQVRAIADSAGREMRRVVRGYREADLGVETAGARSLLSAAGIDCTITGSLPTLDPSATTALAWVMREAVTNVVKHSAAETVEIAFTDGPLPMMIITNDGVRGRRAPGNGHGLQNMSDRIDRAGGRLRHEHDGGRFRLIVELGQADPEAGGNPELVTGREERR